MKIKGIEERIGEFENKPYHNVKFSLCGRVWKTKKVQVLRYQ